ncbi:MAG: ABC transporter substrate-binding protein [Clostridiales bacterium]|nr:ABC transporter substrate-binding protein [Clostridiales bacterium]MDD6872817.1 ABC transporter substrate-binding protein [Clostridiales bacterium]MDD7365824.1 ABC transporter substrate-binding protein [Clostridiales bacterium]MDY2871990.1 ABC transporter substrate-binding protein [Eubacteriales bacterium]
MKKVLALVVALVLVLSFTTVAMAEDTVKIGVFEPSSGDNGAGGRQEVLGIEYANKLKPTVEIGGKTYNVELVVVDNQSASDKAVTAAQSLVSDGVSIVLGSYGSGVSMAGGDVFAAAGIPAIGISCTNPNVTLLCDYYWRICFLDPFQGSVMANFAAEKGCKKAYVLTMLGEDYGNGLGYYFTDAFQKLGGEVVSETFPEGTSDFSAYLNNAVKAGCDVIFAPSATTYASLIIDQAAAQNISFPLMAGDTWENSVILDAAKGKNIDVYVSTFFAEDESNAAAVEFVSGFKAWLNENSDKLTNNGGNDIVAAVSVLGYDAYNVALAALEAAGSVDPADVAAALPSVTYNGITGSIAFDENGDAKKDMAYIKKADGDAGAFVFEKTQSVAELEK